MRLDLEFAEKVRDATEGDYKYSIVDVVYVPKEIMQDWIRSLADLHLLACEYLSTHRQTKPDRGR